MFCSHCGAELENDSRVCSKCGHPVAEKSLVKRSGAASRIRKINIEETKDKQESRGPKPGVHPADDMTEQLPDLTAFISEEISGGQVSQNTENLNAVIRTSRGLDAVSENTVKLEKTAIVNENTVRLEETGAVSENTVRLEQPDAVSENTVRLDGISEELARAGAMGADPASQDTLILGALDFDTVSLDGLELNSMDLDDDETELWVGEKVPAEMSKQPCPQSENVPGTQLQQEIPANAQSQPERSDRNRKSARDSGSTNKGTRKRGKGSKGGNSGSGIWAAVGAMLVLAVIIGAVVFMFRNKVSGPNYSEMIRSGNEYYTEGNYEKATELFKQAIDAFPDKSEGYLGLADVYTAEKNEAGAAEILEKGYDKTHSAQLKHRLDELLGNVSETDRQKQPPATEQTPSETEPLTDSGETGAGDSVQ